VGYLFGVYPIAGGGDPPPSEATLLTTMSIVNTSGSTQSADFVTPMFGHVFKKGDIAGTDYPQFELTDGTPCPATIWAKATWSDGSWKRCSAMLRVPASIAGSGSLTINVKSGGSTPVASVLSTSALTAQDLKVELTSKENITGTLTSALNTGISDNDDVKLIADGAAGKVWRIRQEFMTTAPANHGQLECYHYVTALQNSSGALYGIRWLPRITQPWLDVDSPTKAKRGFLYTLKNGASTTGLVQPVVGSAKTFSTAGGTTITMTGHGLETGMVGVITTTGTLPTGLTAGTTYGVRVLSANTVSFTAQAGDAVRGFPIISVTGSGSGTHTFTPHAQVVQFASVWGPATDGKWQYLQGGGSAATDATVRIEFNKAYWKSTRMLPPYELSLTPNAPSAVSYAPNAHGSLRTAFNDTGGDNTIGVQPAWVARHFMRQDAASELVVRVNALSLGHYSLNVRRQSTGTIPVLNSNGGTPYTGMGTGDIALRWNTSLSQSHIAPYTLPADDGAGCMTAGDMSHWPSSTFYAALITGEPQYDDLMNEVASYAVLHRWDAASETQRNDTTLTGGPYYGFTLKTTDHVREDGWSTRELCLGAGLCADSHWDAAAVKTYLNDMVNTTFTWGNTYNSTKDAFWQNNGLFHFRNADPIGQPWMLNFLCYGVAYGYAVTENTGALTFLSHLMKFPAAVDADVGIYHFTSYNMTMRKTDSGAGALVDDMSQIHYNFFHTRSIDTTTDTVTVTPDSSIEFTLTDGDKVQFGNGGAPTGLTAMTSYFARDVADPGITSAKTFKVADTLGGGAKDITGTTGGTTFFRFTNTTGCAGLTYKGDDQYHDIARGAFRFAEAVGASNMASIRTNMDAICALDENLTGVTTPTNRLTVTYE